MVGEKESQNGAKSHTDEDATKCERYGVKNSGSKFVKGRKIGGGSPYQHEVELMPWVERRDLDIGGKNTEDSDD